ncbi:hypothetical protein Clole_1175 [Cellulosilyticum lentocellum DSM 5427]|uniref:Uncharacterized protein n=2 Tax=Cellulosilyticum lentocellum TaxID=29360 RepID=F2JSS0_CELLD|nr:hypothetical protein Clole_1175 [Cellulosilyticum lentocellum DSM 5427]
MVSLHVRSYNQPIYKTKTVEFKCWENVNGFGSFIFKKPSDVDTYNYDELKNNVKSVIDITNNNVEYLKVVFQWEEIKYIKDFIEQVKKEIENQNNEYLENISIIDDYDEVIAFDISIGN